MFPFQLFPTQLFPSGLFDRPKRVINITQTLILADLVGQFDEILRVDVLTFTQFLTSQLILNETLNQSLFFTQSIIVVGPGPVPVVNVVSLTDHLVFNQLAIPTGLIGLLSGPFDNEIFPNQIFSYHIFPRGVFTEGTSVTPVIIKDKLHFTENLNGQNPTLHDHTFNQTLFLHDYFRTEYGRYVHHFHDQLQFEQELTYTTLPQTFISVPDKLIFVEILHPTLVLRRLCTDHLFLNQDNIQRNIDGNTITIPGLIGTRSNNQKARYVILQSKNSVVILPSPLFGDTQSNVSELKINRSVKGKVYTLIKRTQRQRLTYKFEVKRQKSNELQLFIDDNDLEWINITNWRGEMYYAKIINNPITFSAISRDGRCLQSNERHQVELEFEGFLISSQIGPCE